MQIDNLIGEFRQTVREVGTQFDRLRSLMWRIQAMGGPAAQEVQDYFAAGTGSAQGLAHGEFLGGVDVVQQINQLLEAEDYQRARALLKLT